MSDKTDREKYLKVLEKMFYSMEKLESGVILPTSEVKTALAFAISSIKTDLKYDLLYEGEDELCTGDCDSCAFVDGDYCRVHEKSIKLHITEIKKHQSDFSDLQQEPNSDIRLNGDKNELNRVKNELEPTTKNDLEVEKIVDVLGSYTDLDIPYKHKIAEDILNNLPPVTPQEPRWIPVSERLPEPVNVGALWKREVLITGYLSFDDKKKRFVATELIDNVISKKDVNDIHVIAWMPLPLPWKGR